MIRQLTKREVEHRIISAARPASQAPPYLPITPCVFANNYLGPLRHCDIGSITFEQNKYKMPSPSPLRIQLSALKRLLSEEASYHKELAQQEKRLDKMVTTSSSGEHKEEEELEGNLEFSIEQEVGIRFGH